MHRPKSGFSHESGLDASVLVLLFSTAWIFYYSLFLILGNLIISVENFTCLNTAASKALEILGKHVRARREVCAAVEAPGSKAPGANVPRRRSALL